MIVAWVSGGLGNQMYQYALAFLLANKLNRDLYFDLSFFQRYPQHNGYELKEVFGIDVNGLSLGQIKSIFGWPVYSIFKRILVRKGFGFLRPSYMFVDGQSNLDLVQGKVPCYLFGYWQNEKVILDNKRELKSVFQFPSCFNGVNNDVLNQIQSGNSVSVHVRRGDYVANKGAANHHGVCSIDYYDRAISYALDVIDSPVFFVFSDDIDWAKSNLPTGARYVFVDHNRGGDSYIDMALMANCKVNIIANSTFSWWGGFLNVHEDCIVIAPRKWFQSAPEGDYRIPGDWIRL